ncbi:diacylglycerol kinase [Bacteroidales bacterium]|nr:diacylglycerol kinase [Bacteroidales bacterium]
MKQASFKKQSRLKSFALAFEGLKVLTLGERNFRFHLLAAALVFLAAFFFEIQTYEWLVLLLTVALVLCAEAANTCIEHVCDFICPERNYKIKIIKDIAAGMVLLASIFAAIIGVIIFGPYLVGLFK